MHSRSATGLSAAITPTMNPHAPTAVQRAPDPETFNPTMHTAGITVIAIGLTPAAALVARRLRLERAKLGTKLGRGGAWTELSLKPGRQDQHCHSLSTTLLLKNLLQENKRLLRDTSSSTLEFLSWQLCQTILYGFRHRCKAIVTNNVRGWMPTPRWLRTHRLLRTNRDVVKPPAGARSSPLSQSAPDHPIRQYPVADSTEAARLLLAPCPKAGSRQMAGFIGT